MAGGVERPFRIAHISDVHCGGPYFVPTLLERAIAEVNDWDPDLVVCCGDLTTFGYKPEFAEARAYLDRIECESFVVIPGTTATRALESACEAKGVEPRIAVETDGVESMRRMVARGLGIAMLPRLIAESDPKDVRAIDVGKGRIQRQVAIVHRGEGYLTAAARAFRTLLVKRSVR